MYVFLADVINANNKRKPYKIQNPLFTFFWTEPLVEHASFRSLVLTTRIEEL